MARHVFVLLLVAVCLMQVVLSLPRERRDTEGEGATNILEGIERLASDISKKTQEFFTADSLRALQANATELANKVGSALNSLVDGGASTAAPAS